MTEKFEEIPSQNVFNLGCVTFASNFDNGNLAKVKKIELGLPFEYRIWVAPDNQGTTYQSKQNAWFHFLVSGVPKGNILRIQIANASNHSGLYRYDMRPVYRCNTTGQKWVRIKSCVRYEKQDDAPPQLTFDHTTENSDDIIHFAFTYPYTYAMVQEDMKRIDELSTKTDMENPESIYCCRELATYSLDGRRIDLITITSALGADRENTREPPLEGLFPVVRVKDKGKMKRHTVSVSSKSVNLEEESGSENDRDRDRDREDNKEIEKEIENIINLRPLVFPSKQIVFVSARVHPGEVPAQHTWKGIFDLLTDPTDATARELRRRYVFKMIPMLNPDGVYRGHFRMDQMGENLNRYYGRADPIKQPSIYAATSLIEHYASNKKLCFYLDLHAHASKRGCFIYGNVLDDVNDQIQNQLYCKLVSMNTAHFEYEACLFSREHMKRTDPGDMQKGLTAEGSGRVATYLSHNVIHSYTLECNYNMSRVGNEITPCETDPKGSNVTPSSPYETSPEKYTPSCYAGVGRACIIALLDIRNQNPCSRISSSKYKTLDRVRQSILEEVRSKKEYRDQSTRGRRQTDLMGQSLVLPFQGLNTGTGLGSKSGINTRGRSSAADAKIWRAYADGVIRDVGEELGSAENLLKRNNGKKLERRNSACEKERERERRRTGSFAENLQSGQQSGRKPWVPSDEITRNIISTPPSTRKNSLTNTLDGSSLSRAIRSASAHVTSSRASFSASNTLSTPKHRTSTSTTSNVSCAARYSNLVEDETTEKKTILIPVISADGISFPEKSVDDKNPIRKISFFQMDLPESVQSSFAVARQNIITGSHKLISKTKDNANSKKDGGEINVKNEGETKSTEEETIDSDLNNLIKSKCFIKDPTPTTQISHTTSLPSKIGNNNSNNNNNNNNNNTQKLQLLPEQQITQKFSEINLQSLSDKGRTSPELGTIDLKDILNTQPITAVNPLFSRNMTHSQDENSIYTKSEKSEKSILSQSLLRIKNLEGENYEFENRFPPEVPLSHTGLTIQNNLIEIKNNVQNANCVLNANTEIQNHILGAIPGGKLLFNSGKVNLLNKPLPNRRSSGNYSNSFNLGKEGRDDNNVNAERNLVAQALAEVAGNKGSFISAGRALLL